MIAGIAIAAVWIACGVLHYGFLTAHFWYEWTTLRGREEWVRNRRIVLTLSLFGPCALATIRHDERRHGLLFRYPKDTS